MCSMCNTAPLLRINFQAIKQRKRSDRRRHPDIAEQLKEIEGRDPAQTMRSRVKGYWRRMAKEELIMIRTALNSHQGTGNDVIDKR